MTMQDANRLPNIRHSGVRKTIARTHGARLSHIAIGTLAANAREWRCAAWATNVLPWVIAVPDGPAHRAHVGAGWERDVLEAFGR